MGMFDYVNYQDECPVCKTQIPKENFQTKDSDCNLDILEPKQVNYFNGWCPNKECNTRISYKVHRTCIVDRIEKDW